MKLRNSVLISSLALSLFGLVMIYSASSYGALLHFGDAFFYVKKQAASLVAGLVMMFIGYKIKPEFLNKWKWFIYIFSMALLAMVFIPGVGMSSYGATRWISLGFVTFQPSEISKFGLMIFLAGYMAERPPTGFLKMLTPLAFGLAMCVLVMLEPNMSVTVCIVLSMVILVFTAGVRVRDMAIIGGGLLSAIPLLIIAEPYRLKRLFAYLDPFANPRGEGYQLIQSYYALASGGLFGLGLFQSRQKYLFLPFAESDFIFSIIGEELGFFGSVAVIAVFLVLIIGGYSIAVKAKDKHQSLLAVGITTIIAVQTVVNIAVVSGSIPPTGLPLPFISAGGSSLMVFLMTVGILLNIEKRSRVLEVKL